MDTLMCIAFVKSTVIKTIASFGILNYKKDAQAITESLGYDAWVVVPYLGDGGDMLGVGVGDKVIGNAFCKPNGEVIATVPDIHKQHRVVMQWHG